MELRAGYKQTDVGGIPPEWEVKSLGKFIALQRGHDLTERQRRRGNVPVMGSAGQNGFHDIARARGPGVTLGRSGASFGQAHYCDSDFWPHNTALYVTDFFGNLPLFVFYFLKSIDFSNHNSGSAQQSLNRNFIAPIQVAVPQRSEQEVITAALSDVDALIAALDALIAKKRDIKRAAMQQLLTGRTRLPGFNGDWEVMRLGDIAHIKTGKRNNEDKVRDGAYPLFVRSQTVERINSYSYDCEAILVAGEGGIGNILHYINGKFDCHQRVYKISEFDSNTNGKFIYFCMVYGFHKQATRNSVKATVDSLRLPTFQDFEFARPELEEQTAIATALSDMDAEIAALEAKRDKVRVLKQGMMQELLTGRIRLI
jgi:type I restriction enzyme S subunit